MVKYRFIIIATLFLLFFVVGDCKAGVKVWLTKGDQSVKLKKQSKIVFTPGAGEPSDYQILVEENTKFQKMEGFGAALTDSSALLIKNLPKRKRRKLLKKLFSKKNKGIRISSIRLPIGASDFSVEPYTYDDIPCGETDFELEKFSIKHDEKYIIPVLKKAIRKNSQLKIMASPWTAPAWMKDDCSLYGGQLLEEPGYTEIYSDYIVRFIQAYQKKGISIQALTLQNEPLKEDINLPTMGMDWWDQVNLLVYDLVKDLKIAGIDTEIILYDHNWDNTDYPLTVLNDLQINHNEQYQAISGTAFHCYMGTPDGQTLVHTTHPGKGVYLTECTGWYKHSEGQGPGDNFEGDLVWEVQNLLIGAVRNWAKTVILWNLALDQNGGPHLPTACGENDGNKCRGLVTINTKNNEISYHVEYYVIGHASKFVSTGAYRIASDTYDGKIDTVAFQNPNGSKVLIVLNSSGEALDFKVLWNNKHFSYILDKSSVATFKWK